MKLNHVSLDFKVSNCHYRCKHCDSPMDGKCDKNVPFSYIQDITLPFLECRNKLYDEVRLGISDSPFAYSEYPKVIPFRIRHGGMGKHTATEAIDGTKFTRDFFDSTIHRIVESGLKKVSISLFGLERNHNEFVAYKSSFTELMHCAEILNGKGVNVRFTVFLTPKNISELDDLTEILQTVTNKENIGYWYSNCRSRNHALCPDFLLRISDSPVARKYGLELHSEKEMMEYHRGRNPKIPADSLWIRIFVDGTYGIPIWDLGEFRILGNVKNETVQNIVEKGTECLQSMQKILPTFNELMDSVANAENPYLYHMKDALSIWWYRYKKYEKRDSAQLF